MDATAYPTSAAQHLRVVQQLLWTVVCEKLNPAERDEVKRAVGGTLVDENESIYKEASALAEILGDVQLDTASLLTRFQLCSNPQRSMVEAEIRVLMERLQRQAVVSPFNSSAVKERDPDSLMPRTSKKEKAVLDYMATSAQLAEGGARPPSSLPPRPTTSSSRPTTAPSRPGTASPSTMASRPSSPGSSNGSSATRYTDAGSVVAGVADRLSAATIGQVRDTLRTALLDERGALLEDVEYLQGLLDAEADLQVRAAVAPPSVSELKEYSRKLEEVLRDEEARIEHEARVSTMFAVAEQQPGKAGRLRGMVTVSRGATPPTPGASRGGSAPQTLVVHGDSAGERQRPASSESASTGASSAAAMARQRSSSPACASAARQSSVSQGGSAKAGSTQVPAVPDGPQSPSPGSGAGASLLGRPPSRGRSSLLDGPSTSGAVAAGSLSPVRTPSKTALASPGLPSSRRDVLLSAGSSSSAAVHDNGSSAGAGALEPVVGRASSLGRGAAPAPLLRSLGSLTDATTSAASPTGSTMAAGRARLPSPGRLLQPLAAPGSPAAVRPPLPRPPVTPQGTNGPSGGSALHASHEGIASSSASSNGLLSKPFGSLGSLGTGGASGAPGSAAKNLALEPGVHLTRPSGKTNVVERLEEEVESVKGGVAAILAKHNYSHHKPVG